MEPFNQSNNFNKFNCMPSEAERKRGRIITGIMFVLGGLLYIADQSKLITLPDWVFSWKMLMIAVGLIIGIKHNFRRMGWIILVLIGAWGIVSNDLCMNLDLSNYFLPVVFIIIGLIFIIKPKRRFHPSWRKHWQQNQNFNMNSSDSSTEDFIDYNVVFGGVKKNVVSKNFKGGEINNVFGGSEINLTQADFSGVITLEINNVFGGTKLIVPSHWQIKSEITAVMGGVEDRRNIQPNSGIVPDKILVINGNTFFGGIDIRNY
ncbi:MAG: hypothetical protein RIQ33_1762 [Bacteroidota bacterium]|jgi:predicted membrane protein